MDEEISYENKIHLAFDEPLEYKDILLYPATLQYYYMFSMADECLDVNRLNEKDKRLLRLPYLDYMYEKSLIDKTAEYKWNMLIYILRIVLGESQPFDVIRENGIVKIKVHQRSENYELLNKEYTILQNKILSLYKEGNNFDSEIVREKELEDKMYHDIIIDTEDFEHIRKMIMIQNDIKSEHFDSKTEELLNKTRDKLNKVHKDSSKIDLEDLVTIVSYMQHINPTEMKNMTLRRFNRYLNIALNKDDYYMYKGLEVSGMIKPKTEIKSWVSHYEPKSKYDGLLISSSEIIPSLGDGGKI